MSQHNEPEILENPRSERVRRVAGLATRSARQKQGLFMVEGPQPVREALALWLRRWETGQASETDRHLPALDALFFDPAGLERHPDVLALVERLRGVLFNPEIQLPQEARIFLREATPEVLRAMGDAETSQGMLAVCRIPAEEEFGGSGAGVDADLIAGLLRLKDPGNVGTIIRTADAAGAGAVVLTSGSVDPWSPKVVRAAAGSHFHLRLFTGIAAPELASRARVQGAQVLAADGEGETSLTELSAPQAPTLWLLGNEAHGLTAEEKALADHRVAIPIYGAAESLNVATAATVCLYASAMAQHASPQAGLRAGSGEDSTGGSR